MTYTANAYYLLEHGENPVEIATDDDVSALIDAMVTQPLRTSVVKLYIQERPRHSVGVPDHELCIGVQGDRKVGSVRFQNGLNVQYAKGEADGSAAIDYYYQENEVLFPPDALVDLDALKAVAADFLASGAAQTPTGAEWVPWPDEPLGDEDDDGF